MNRIERSELLPLGEYELIRERFRGRVIEQKKQRRVFVGPHMSAVFENRDTVLLQIQEMLRTERITNEQGVQHEIETYNELVPGDDELSLTLFVEIAEPEQREQVLRELVGLQYQVALQIEAESFQVTGERQGADADRTTAVHYLKCKLSAEAAERVRAGRGRMALIIDHPKYQHQVEFVDALKNQLASDLAWSS